MPFLMSGVKAWVIAGTIFLALPAMARPVDLLLVLAVDSSGSIDPDEFRFQRQGYADALTSDAVLGAIRSGPMRSIAVAFLEWGSPGAPALVLDWTLIESRADAEGFATALLAQPRRPQSYNAIGDGIELARKLIEAAPHEGSEKVIDVSGDGPDMRGIVPAPVARDAAVAAGITVNALAIARPGGTSMSGEGLVESYRALVIGGPGSFVEVASDYPDFGRAIRSKLVKEIAWMRTPEGVRLAARVSGPKDPSISAPSAVPR